MAIEIECKVRIDRKDVSDHFHSISAYMKGVIVQKIEKKDSYYSNIHDSVTLFRMRQVGNESILTRKIKEERSDGVEVNQEIEFILPYQTSIHPFFSSLGYRVVIEKEKKGWSWVKGSLTIELVEVAPLGVFIEIEVLVEERKETEAAIIQLSEIRKSLGIEELELIAEYYNDMLKKIRK